ncbi:hypothetical protein ACHJH3_06190 [Campylobacter sp. MOP7]|uniref:hypothetical protein n=1 Tax=Campylobacter canis TaxID=3378588 RepID=UPI00387EB262
MILKKHSYLNRRNMYNGEIFDERSTKVLDEIAREKQKLEGKYNRKLHISSVFLIIKRGTEEILTINSTSEANVKRKLLPYIYYRLPKPNNNSTEMLIQGEIHFKNCDIFLKREPVEDIVDKSGVQLYRESWVRYREDDQ